MVEISSRLVESSGIYSENGKRKEEGRGSSIKIIWECQETGATGETFWGDWKGRKIQDDSIATVKRYAKEKIDWRRYGRGCK